MGLSQLTFGTKHTSELCMTGLVSVPDLKRLELEKFHCIVFISIIQLLYNYRAEIVCSQTPPADKYD